MMKKRRSDNPIFKEYISTDIHMESVEQIGDNSCSSWVSKEEYPTDNTKR